MKWSHKVSLLLITHCKPEFFLFTIFIAFERAHLVCYSHEYLGGEKNGARKSEPAWKPLNFEFRPCKVTQGIKYLTNTSGTKCKQTRQQIFTLERIEFFMNVLE